VISVSPHNAAAIEVQRIGVDEPWLRIFPTSSGW
jgi:hypothetical protein